MKEVEKYISHFEPEIQARLNELRQLFFDLSPTIEEQIRYNMPAYRVGKKYLYFAAYKKHIGFYPVYGLEEIEEDLAKYRAKGTKDTLHFLHNHPLPVELITKIINMVFVNRE
ncbi:uncharacterized protein YdhG (YjbR/CyaY superfamily) [Pedobacter sp. CAN_A7]|uniref:iron chaperone n=1 Tax=Pedobacter sp. CAN_A7 TaxID=2787722 RepID=UPI0018C9F0F6